MRGNVSTDLSVGGRRDNRPGAHEVRSEEYTMEVIQSTSHVTRELGKAWVFIGPELKSDGPCGGGACL